MEFDTVILSVLIPAVIVLIIMCLLSCFRCKKGSGPVPATNSNVYTVPTNYNAVNSNSFTVPVHTTPPATISRNFGHRRISSIGDRFMVPLDLLPPNFDYNAPGVQHKGDHVIVKDLRLIQMPTSDEYQKQSPYNPNFT